MVNLIIRVEPCKVVKNIDFGMFIANIVTKIPIGAIWNYQNEKK